MQQGEFVVVYCVKPGDTLSDIAEKFLGDSRNWDLIYDQNLDTIGFDPNLIRPGQIIWFKGVR